MVFDLETETHSRYKRKASPFLPENWVVMRGWKLSGDARGYATYHPTLDRTTYLEIPDDVMLLVGFNLKFDLLWEMAQGNSSLKAFFKRGGKIWCCQYAEYLIRGAQKEFHMCSLDQIIESYGGRKKIDEVKLLWEAGVKTSEIDEDLLCDYLLGTREEMRNSGDIGNTDLIFKGQIALAMKQGQTKMIQDRMDGLLCTTEMEFRGLKVDVKEASRRLKVLTADLQQQTKTLASYLPPLPFDFNWNSKIQASAVIFGGTVKYEVRETYIDEETGELARLKATAPWPLFDKVAIDPAKCIPVETSDYTYYRREDVLGYKDQDFYLSGTKKGLPKFKKVDVPGELKIKWQDRSFKFDGYTKGKAEWKTALTDYLDGPVYSTSGDVIEELAASTDIPFLKALEKKQSLDKEIGTYYVKVNDKGEAKGMLTCVQPWDHMLHHKLNHTSTVTTRLSANDPNMQNIPRADVDKLTGEAKSEVKKMFVSRFGEDGRMIEIDYSQLEVVVQGVLSKDPQLCEDLRNKIDFHCKRVSAKHHITYEQAVDWCKKGVSFEALDAKGLSGGTERTKCKVFSFQRAYGAGAAKIALTTGMDIEEVKTLMENEDLMYPGIVRFNSLVEQRIVQTAEPFQAYCEITGKWRVFRKGYYKAPTGTIYTFRTWDAPAFLKRQGVEESFSPPEMKNYPTQGTGGEFVQSSLGRLWRHFVANDNYGDKAFLVNTVHDCVWFDVHKDVVDQVAADAIRIMEGIPQFYNERYDLGIDVPFPVEAEFGMNMQELEHWPVKVAT